MTLKLEELKVGDFVGIGDDPEPVWQVVSRTHEVVIVNRIYEGVNPRESFWTSATKFGTCRIIDNECEIPL